ncbi:MAG: hypothetical protein KC486_18850 [Myxococcales bacterium]|nr:hypothetical protein [Myxococcales bacterium]
MSDVTSGNEVLDAIWSVLRRRIVDRGIAATELGAGLLRELGPLTRRDGELFAGGHRLNHDEQILPHLARATGLGFALYLGNRRIATSTILDAGRAPPIDAYADSELVDVCLRRGEVFKGPLRRAETPYQVIARPLLVGDRSGGSTPIGIIEAFQDERAYYELLAVSAKRRAAAHTREQDLWADEIASVGTFLDDVARRLQLLALNGNIIAAQAGEHGRAFRVVCRELGALADRARGTVTDVRKLLQAMGQDADDHGLLDSASQDPANDS